MYDRAMDSVYTTTITHEAKKRGIRIRVVEPTTPIFILQHGGEAIRCYNALTDRVGAVSFHMAQNKYLANQFLRSHGVPVPVQERFSGMAQAASFLAGFRSVVVKPCTQWGGRGVSVAVSDRRTLRAAVRRAMAYEDDVVLEECVSGEDFRLIFVGGELAAAILRKPAGVWGNGRDNVRKLVEARNNDARKRDPSNLIPIDDETRRNLSILGRKWSEVPDKGAWVQVRLTSNYHTGGSVEVVTECVPRPLLKEARKVVRLLGIPVIGIDFLFQPGTGRYWLIELSPDLAISPPEGEEVAKRFLDYLFPETACKDLGRERGRKTSVGS